jgi:hypothetical protein
MFLKTSFHFGQILNDLLDRESDLARNQPNFWNIHGKSSFRRIVDELAELTTGAETLPLPYRAYGTSRVADLAGYGVQVADRLLADR